VRAQRQVERRQQAHHRRQAQHQQRADHRRRAQYQQRAVRRAVRAAAVVAVGAAADRSCRTRISPLPYRNSSS
jgi:hypothetical protein